MHIRRQRFRVIAELAKRAHRNLAAITDRQCRARKRLVRNRVFDHSVGRLQLRSAARIHRLHDHRIRRQLDPKARFQINSRDRHRQMPAHGNLPEQRSRRGNLCHVADPKSRQPRFRLRKILNQIGTAQSNGDHRLSRFIKLFRERRLLRRNIHISLAIAHAHKKRQNRQVVRIRRRKLKHIRLHEPRIRPQRRQRIESRKQLAFQILSRIRLRIRVQRQQQPAQRLRAVQRQPVRRIPQQRHSSIRNILRFFLPRGAAEFFIDRVHICSASNAASGTGGINTASAPAATARTAASPGAFRAVIPPMSIASVTMSP